MVSLRLGAAPQAWREDQALAPQRQRLAAVC